MTCCKKFEQLDLLFCVKLYSQSTTRDQLVIQLVPGYLGLKKMISYVRSSLIPIHKAGLCILDAVTVSWERSICRTLIHDQLYALDAATKMSMEVASNGRVCDFVLFIGRIFGIGNMQ